MELSLIFLIIWLVGIPLVWGFLLAVVGGNIDGSDNNATLGGCCVIVFGGIFWPVLIILVIGLAIGFLVKWIWETLGSWKRKGGRNVKTSKSG